jgi:hypothetical protein
MKPLRRILIALAAALLAAPVGAQTVQTGAQRSFATRAELEAAAEQAQSSNRSADAALIRSRLDHGDFQTGDRVLVTVEGAGGLSDTLMVEAGPKLPIPQLGELSLQGVLRSELVPRLKAHVDDYLRLATVRATPLVRVAVLGNVSRPGFYYTFADVPISDALMAAGGPTGDADVGKIQVRRGTRVIANPARMRAAMTSGLSIDALHMLAGDEIHVGKKRQIDSGTVISISGLIVGVIAAVAAASR